MRRRELDVLLVAAKGDGCSRGRLTYLADIKNFVEPCSITVFPLEGEPTIFMDPVRIYALSDWIPDVRATANLGVDVAEHLLDLGLAKSRIGTVGFEDSVTLRDWRSLSSRLPDLGIETADSVYEEATLKKTDPEIEALRHAAELARQAMADLEPGMRPGVLPAELVAEVQRSLRANGCADAAVAFSRTPFRGLGCRAGGWLIGGTAYDPAPLDEDDLFTFEIDVAGPEGYWVELRRRYRFKEFKDRERRFWDLRCSAFEAGRESMTAGADSRAVEASIESVYRKAGYLNEDQVSFHAHGTGVSAVEPPTCPGSPRELESGMAIVLHPLLWLERDESRAVGDLAPVDTLLVTESGAERLVDHADELTVLDV